MLDLEAPLEAFSSHSAGEGYGFDYAELASGAAGKVMADKAASELAIPHQPSVVEEAAFEFDEEGNIVYRDGQEEPPAIEEGGSGGLVTDDQGDFELDLGVDQHQTAKAVSPVTEQRS